MSENPKEIYRIEAIRARSRIDYNFDDFEKAAALFFDKIEVSAQTVLALYWPKDREFDVRPVLQTALRQNITCCLPVVERGSKILEFIRWEEGDKLEKGPYNIYEPQRLDNSSIVIPDIIIVPLLAFDRQGYRLGYGGGYYDATIEHLKKEKPVTTVGMAYAEQATLFNLPQEDHDQKLDYVITPLEIHSF